MKKILITPRKEDTEKKKLSVNESYFIALSDAYSYMSNIVNEEQARQMALEFDGLLVTGGYDINPSLYKEENTKSLGIEDSIDKTDINLINAFIGADKPILGICRGLQIINVALGGTLIQDIPNEYNTDVVHSGFDGKVATHPISVEENTFLHSILGSNAVVNSYHHQAIGRLAEPLKTSAYSSDGIIEAVEGKNILALQWHPERMLDDEKQKKIFDWISK